MLDNRFVVTILITFAQSLQSHFQIHSINLLYTYTENIDFHETAGLRSLINGYTVMR